MQVQKKMCGLLGFTSVDFNSYWLVVFRAFSQQIKNKLMQQTNQD